MKKFNNISWKNAIIELHKPENVNKKGSFLSRLIFDEIMSNFLINSKIRKSIKKIKKNRKKFDNKPFEIIKQRINYKLTNDQVNAINEIRELNPAMCNTKNILLDFALSKTKN